MDHHSRSTISSCNAHSHSPAHSPHTFTHLPHALNHPAQAKEAVAARTKAVRFEFESHQFPSLSMYLQCLILNLGLDVCSWNVHASLPSTLPSQSTIDLTLSHGAIWCMKGYTCRVSWNKSGSFWVRTSPILWCISNVKFGMSVWMYAVVVLMRVYHWSQHSWIKSTRDLSRHLMYQ